MSIESLIEENKRLKEQLKAEGIYYHDLCNEFEDLKKELFNKELEIKQYEYMIKCIETVLDEKIKELI